MDGRLITLERIAALALQVRILERELIPATDVRIVMERLKQARQDLDAELAELSVLDWKR